MMIENKSKNRVNKSGVNSRNKSNIKRFNGPQSDQSIVLEIDELLNEINDFLWLWNGKPIWIYQKIRFAPNMISEEDRQNIDSFLEKMPDLIQLMELKQTIQTRLPDNRERKDRIDRMERAITRSEKGRKFLLELKEKINTILEQQNTILKSQTGSFSLASRQSTGSNLSLNTRASRNKRLLIAFMNRKASMERILQIVEYQNNKKNLQNSEMKTDSSLCDDQFKTNSKTN